ncbi:hypothetical protein GCM10010124_21670 [Pilimelia terevasa]|uniref:Uncharacterized protein n=1 Tax=Pilimelia terevasa TaxID=53372 RepID=A0A8J3BRN9_9ACTN|nr:hypothetical protein [Pilimelia terevasa]GGK28636.1 hypothetical protein GCM10010124_21670 [Pilimelia terevasa]
MKRTIVTAAVVLGSLALPAVAEAAPTAPSGNVARQLSDAARAGRADCGRSSLFRTQPDGRTVYASNEMDYTGALANLVRLRAPADGPWEELDICAHLDGGSTYLTFQSIANDKYLSAELGATGIDYGMVRARGERIGPWEKFDIDCDGDEGPCYLKSLANNRYLSVEEGHSGTRKNMLRARSATKGEWERFF